MIILGIETSCDETAAAVVTATDGAKPRILANVVLSQLDEHRPYGGVVPEIAARAHVEAIDGIIAEAMQTAGIEFDDLDGVAATGGPGLIGGVMVGVMTAKALAFARDLPFIAVNHLEAHALTVRLCGDENGNAINFPYLLLLVSGGHCQLLSVEGVGQYRRLGTTMDDALGEAFDKTAKMMGLGYPGGPAVESTAASGDPNRFDLPRPMKGRAGCDFSFSGLKTKVRQTIEALPPGDLLDQDKADLCASFQHAAGDVLIDRCANAIEMFQDLHPQSGPLVIAGGVAANVALRSRLEALAQEKGMAFAAPPLALCTDNGAMVAWAGLEHLRLGHTDALDFKPLPRWPLDPDAPKAAFAGAKA
jgi:N6-L-threonylcarbamoyladenine synthase